MEWIGSSHGKTVLVTGATGFIGQHVVSQGIAAGFNVYTLSSSSSDNDTVPHHSVSVLDREALFQVMNELLPQGVIHLAAAGVAYDSYSLFDLMQVNTLGAENLLAASASIEPMPHVVLAGSGFEYAPQSHALTEADEVAPLTPYGVSKAGASLCAAYYGRRIPVTLLRLFSVYGPGEGESRLVPQIIRSAQAGMSIDLTGGEQCRDFTFVTDVATAFWKALQLPPRGGAVRTLNVGTGRGQTLRTFIDMLGSLLVAAGYPVDACYGKRPYRTDEPMMYVSVPSQLRNALGWQPEITPREGLQAYLDTVL